MEQNFGVCLDTTLVYEGGFANNPKDPGGRTMKGVTQRTFDAYMYKKGKPKRDVKTITRAELEDCYRSGFWNTVGGDTLPSGVDMVAFDYGVNSGPGRAVSTLNKVRNADAKATIKAVCASRLSFLHGLKTWGTFGGGWGKRVHSVEARALTLNAGSPRAAVEVLKAEAATSTKKATTLVTATTAHVSTSAPAVVVAHSALPVLALVLLGIVVVAAAGFLIWRSVVANSRANVMKSEINGLQNPGAAG